MYIDIFLYNNKAILTIIIILNTVFILLLDKYYHSVLNFKTLYQLKSQKLV